ncbi:MAG: hypothetical protein NZ585_13505 [Chloracidobacterium sp.]|nr:hypothetical protein [Chloracidobacterium sp.]MDW8218853.1 hypothetical protein [Acidobacteriota bacterium]
MLCPCCGREQQDLRQGCLCGARAVAAPQTDAIVELPRVGWAVTGLVCAVVGLGGFLTPWLLPLAGLGAYAGWTAYRRAQREPAQFGGLRLARVAVILSGLTLPGLLLFGAYRAHAWYVGRQESARAISRARMLELALAIQAYRRQRHALPSPQLDELRTAGLLSGPVNDKWGKALRYQPTGELAAANPSATPVLTQYRIVSAGEDGEFGTADDLILQDGVFIPPPRATDK